MPVQVNKMEECEAAGATPPNAKDSGLRLPSVGFPSPVPGSMYDSSTPAPVSRHDPVAPTLHIGLGLCSSGFHKHLSFPGHPVSAPSCQAHTPSGVDEDRNDAHSSATHWPGFSFPGLHADAHDYVPSGKRPAK